MVGGRITSLEVQGRAGQRVRVYVDGTFAFSVAAVIATTLRVGDRLTRSQIAALQARDEVERAHERALAYLSYRPRSEMELRRYLHSKRFSEHAISEVLDRLRRVALVDDEAFARYWVEQRARFRPRGVSLLTQELRRKGIADEIIEMALATYDEVRAAQQVAREHLRRLAHLPPDIRRRRLIGRLSRRGFDYALIRDVLASLPAPLIYPEESEEA